MTIKSIKIAKPIKTAKSGFVLLAVTGILAVTGCQSITDNMNNHTNMTNSQRATMPVSTHTVSSIEPSYLTHYNWHLIEAKDAMGNPAVDLNSLKHNTALTFRDQNGQLMISFGVGCNTMNGSAKLSNNVLTLQNVASTMMACGDEGMGERMLANAMNGSSQLQLQTGSGGSSTLHPSPILTQKAADGSTLLWQGKLTPEAKYQQTGETVFWEIDNEPAICPDNTAKCLRVRPISYDSRGIRTGEGEWMLFVDNIEGYAHDRNADQVVRLKHYVIDPVDIKGKQDVYVFDMVVESHQAN